MAADRDESATEFKMRKIVEEMMETEEAYVQSLRDIEDGYLIPCLHYRKPVGPLEWIDVELVFANIQALRILHEELLERLNYAMTAPHYAGTIFSDTVDGFKQHYVEYCANSNASMEVLTAWLTDPKIAQFLAKLSQDLSKPLGLAPELLKPVQRILKYPLLLKELLKVSHAGDDGYDDAANAVQQLNEVAELINERKRAAENMEKVLNLERRLDNHKGSLLDYGLLLLQANFRVAESRKSRPSDRSFFLFERGLLIAKEDPSNILRKDDVRLSFKAFIELSKITVNSGKESGSDRWYFEVNSVIGERDKVNTYTAYCTSKQQCDDWASKINELQQESLIAFLKAKTKNQELEDVDGTVGLNRVKMREREERLVQLRARKKGDKIPPPKKTAGTLFAQRQQPASAAVKTAEQLMPTYCAAARHTPSIGSTSELSVSTAAEGATGKEGEGADEEPPARDPAPPPAQGPPGFARRRPPPPMSPAVRQSRPSSTPPTSPPPPPPQRPSGIALGPSMSLGATPAERKRSIPATPPPMRHRAQSAISLEPPPTPTEPEAPTSAPSLPGGPLSAPPTPLARPDAQQPQQPPPPLPSQASAPRLIRPPSAPPRGPPPLLPKPGGIGRSPPPIAPKPTRPSKPEAPSETAPEKKAPPPVAPKPAPPPGLGRQAPPPPPPMARSPSPQS